MFASQVSSQNVEAPGVTRDAGLSLIELLCVIVVLGVLATIVVFSVGGTTDRAAEAARGADEATLVTALEAYHVQHGYYPSEDVLVGTGLLRAPSNLWDVVVADGADDFTLVPVDSAVPTTAVTASTTLPTATTAPTTTAAPVTTAAPTTAAPTTTAAPVTTAVPTTVTPTTVTPTTVTPTTVTPTTLPAPTGVTCSFVVYDAWGSGGNAALSIRNGGDAKITTWTVRIAHGGRTINLWGASDAGADGTYFTASDAGWNAVVAPGQTAQPTGGSVSGAGLTKGQELGCTVVPTQVDTGKVTCSFTVTGTPWPTGANATLTIANDSSARITNWTVAIATSAKRTISVRNASTIVGATSVTASSLSWNGVVEAGTSATPASGSISGSGITAGESIDCVVVSVG